MTTSDWTAWGARVISLPAAASRGSAGPAGTGERPVVDDRSAPIVEDAS